VEDNLRAARTLRQRAALAIFEDPGLGGKVLGWLNVRCGKRAADTFDACNSGAHGPYKGNLGGLVSDTEKLVQQVRLKLA
jgi:hypothetical protein